MENKFTENKRFILGISLLHICLFITVWVAKSESVSTVFRYVAKADMTETAPLLVQMLNKWYFIGL